MEHLTRQSALLELVAQAEDAANEYDRDNARITLIKYAYASSDVIAQLRLREYLRSLNDDLRFPVLREYSWACIDKSERAWAYRRMIEIAREKPKDAVWKELSQFFQMLEPSELSEELLRYFMLSAPSHTNWARKLLGEHTIKQQTSAPPPQTGFGEWEIPSSLTLNIRWKDT